MSTVFRKSLAIIFGVWNSRGTVNVLYETTEMIKGKLVPCQLFEDGTFKVNGETQSWYEEKKGVPWIPRKRKRFISLVREMIREGDFN
jgi:hypothetical protein